MPRKNFYDRRNFLGTAAKTMAAGSLLVTGFANAESVRVNEEISKGIKPHSGDSVTNQFICSTETNRCWPSQYRIC